MEKKYKGIKFTTFIKFPYMASIAEAMAFATIAQGMMKRSQTEGCEVEPFELVEDENEQKISHKGIS
jgi:hypothetical protein